MTLKTTLLAILVPTLIVAFGTWEIASHLRNQHSPMRMPDGSSMVMSVLVR
jgi:hypothetical protein